MPSMRGWTVYSFHRTKQLPVLSSWTIPGFWRTYGTFLLHFWQCYVKLWMCNCFPPFRVVAIVPRDRVPIEGPLAALIALQVSESSTNLFSSDDNNSIVSWIAGKFHFGGNACQECQLGRANPNTLASSCPRCEAGRFASSTGLTECSICNGGQYQDSKGASG